MSIFSASALGIPPTDGQEGEGEFTYKVVINSDR